MLSKCSIIQVHSSARQQDSRWVTFELQGNRRYAWKPLLPKKGTPRTKIALSRLESLRMCTAVPVCCSALQRQSICQRVATHACVVLSMNKTSLGRVLCVGNCLLTAMKQNSMSVLLGALPDSHSNALLAGESPFQGSSMLPWSVSVARASSMNRSAANMSKHPAAISVLTSCGSYAQFPCSQFLGRTGSS